MFKSFFFCVIFASISCISHQFGRLISGAETLTEKQFLNHMSGNLINLIENNLFQNALKNDENMSSLKFYSYICGTQQVVSGLKIQVEFLACARNIDGTCNFDQSPFKCTTKMRFQPWLVGLRDDPLNVLEAPKCDVLLDVASAAECSLTQTSKSLFKNNYFKSVMSMDKESTYHKQTKILFDKFIEKYAKDYSNDENEYENRYKIFSRNLKIAKGLNKLERGTAVYGVTKFMDYTADEFRKFAAPGLKEKKVEIRQLSPDEINSDAIPTSFDWRKLGAVTEVKNQGECGSCWAFSTTGNIEGQWFIAKKKLVSLSEQELVDCDKVDKGCNGGLPSIAYKQIEMLGGLETEKAYPYEAVNDECKFHKSKVRVYINDSVALPPDEEKMAAWLVSHGPISIGINANAMQFYFGGISHPWKIFCNPNKLDHGVLIVGYGEEKSTPFWIIKNSWGPGWGEKGYYLLFRGDDSCGVNKMATSAIVD